VVEEGDDWSGGVVPGDGGVGAFAGAASGPASDFLGAFAQDIGVVIAGDIEDAADALESVEDARVAAADGAVGFVEEFEEVAVEDEGVVVVDDLIEQVEEWLFLVWAEGVASADSQVEVGEHHGMEEALGELVESGLTEVGVGTGGFDGDALGGASDAGMAHGAGIPEAAGEQGIGEGVRFLLGQVSGDGEALVLEDADGQ